MSVIAPRPRSREFLRTERRINVLLDAQGVYYIVTGLWPLVAYGSFEALLGAKTDDGLVRLVALLAVAIGLSLLLRSRRQPLQPQTLLLAVGAATSFASIGFWYAATGRIAALYLADAALEGLFALGVATGWATCRWAYRGDRL